MQVGRQASSLWCQEGGRRIRLALPRLAGCMPGVAWRGRHGGRPAGGLRREKIAVEDVESRRARRLFSSIASHVCVVSRDGHSKCRCRWITREARPPAGALTAHHATPQHTTPQHTTPPTFVVKEREQNDHPSQRREPHASTFESDCAEVPARMCTEPARSGKMERTSCKPDWKQCFCALSKAFCRRGSKQTCSALQRKHRNLCSLHSWRTTTPAASSKARWRDLAYSVPTALQSSRSQEAKAEGARILRGVASKPASAAIALARSPLLLPAGEESSMHCRSATRGKEPGSAARTAPENPKWHSEQTAQEVGQQSACLTLTFDPARCRLPAACSCSLVCRAALVTRLTASEWSADWASSTKSLRGWLKITAKKPQTESVTAKSERN